MAHVNVYNHTGEKEKELALEEAVFSVKPNSGLIHQVYTSMRANARQPWAHAKDRGEVSGGGKKPWKQKGTGRARHGSIRSPIWRGGGITFGPLSTRTYTQKINKKMKSLAVKMCLTDKVMSDHFIVLNSFDFKGKVQAAVEARNAVPGSGKSTIVITPEVTAELRQAMRNIPRIDIVRASDVSVVDLLNHQYIVTIPEAVEVLHKRFS